MNTKNLKLDATILGLTVRSAQASFLKAVENGNHDRADKIKHALRLASAKLREALDFARQIAKHPRKDETIPPEKAEAAIKNLIADLDRIHAVLAWEPSLPKAPPVTLGEALKRAGVAH